MSHKEYLERLKEEDYIAWDSIVNDPMVVGSGGDDCFGCGFLLIVIVAVAFVTGMCFC